MLSPWESMKEDFFLAKSSVDDQVELALTMQQKRKGLKTPPVVNYELDQKRQISYST